jgi:cystathionine beta-lyase
VNPLIQKGSTVLLPDARALYDDDAFVTYGRSGLASHEALKSALCDLERAEAVELYPSGVAAVAGALLAVLEAGDELLMTDTAYKPTRRFCDRTLARFGVSTRYYDPTLPPDEVEALMGPRTRLIFLESPGSLSFEMQDVPALATIARRRRILSLIDNTWGAGHVLKPLDLGVDISIQALTKYVGGHSDSFMGSAATRDPDIAARLKAGVTDLGWSVAAEDAYAMLRGMRTLDVRLRRHEATGLALASWLEARPEVLQVLHPALPGSPGHAHWRSLCTTDAAACLFSVVLDARFSQTQVDAFVDALRLFRLAYSWAGPISLVVPYDLARSRARWPAQLARGMVVRFAVGLEDPQDLHADIAQALALLRT